MKKCYKCKELLEDSCFYVKKNNKLYHYCIECCRLSNKLKSKEQIAKHNKINRERHKETMRARNTLDYINNREKYIKLAVTRERERKLTDSKYLLTRRLRDRIRKAFKRFSVNGKVMTCKEYGIDFNEIFEKIGKCPGSGYELDHIIPLVKFNLDDILHVRLANSSCNLRWISSYENRTKHDTIPSIAYEDENLRFILSTIGLL